MFPNLLLSHSPWLQSAQHAAWRALSSRSGPPLSLFVCAVDEESDRAGAALVTALKQLSGREVQLHGVVSGLCGSINSINSRVYAQPSCIVGVEGGGAQGRGEIDSATAPFWWHVWWCDTAQCAVLIIWCMTGVACSTFVPPPPVHHPFLPCAQGGAQLCELGLRSVVSEEQLQQLAAAEVIPPTYKIFKVCG